MPSFDDQERYYTTRWNAFTFANQLDLARIATVLETMARVGFESAPAICDLGCGSGWATNILGSFGTVCGVDLSDTAEAARRYPHCSFVSANVLEWSGPESAFDFVVSLEVIEHIERPLQSAYVAQAHRLLKPGGHLVLTTPNAHTMRAMPGGGRDWSNQPVEEWLTATELRRLLGVDFEVLQVRSFIPGLGSRGTYRIVNSAKVRSLMRAAGALRLWERMALQAGYGAHLVALARKPER